jgi:hypothetical protein
VPKRVPKKAKAKDEKYKSHWLTREDKKVSKASKVSKNPKT